MEYDRSNSSYTTEFKRNSVCLIIHKKNGQRSYSFHYERNQKSLFPQCNHISNTNKNTNAKKKIINAKIVTECRRGQLWFDPKKLQETVSQWFIVVLGVLNNISKVHQNPITENVKISRWPPPVFFDI